jgi:23S rRNA (guanosine2251-2'-O)-methyltransferase
MTSFEIHQCSNPDCGLRLPVDLEIHRGEFCPRCGAALTRVSKSYQHQILHLDSPRSFRFEVLLDNVRSAYNVGAIFRTADGAGVDHVYLCGITPNPEENPAIGKTALGAEKEVSWSAYPNALRLAADLREKRHRLLALEGAPDAVPLGQFHLDALSERPLLLIVGNERAGVDPGLMDLCETVLALPMAGCKASLNVAVSFGIAAYWLLWGCNGMAY